MSEITDEILDRSLGEHFGLATFRPMQREAIRSVLDGRDALVVMPTGGGKSLCYQLPALLLEGVAIIVSPLIALMKDQVDNLKQHGIPAVALNSTMSFSEMRGTIGRAERGDLKIIFVAPERLESTLFKEELQRLKVSFIAIDEAHCISEWGHDFRTSYRRIPELYKSFPDGRPSIIALTATATPEVRADILRMLDLKEPLEIVTGFDRPNIYYGVLTESNKFARLADLAKQTSPQSMIVYTASRLSAVKTADALRANGYRAAPYHAGLSADERKSTQQKFRSDEIAIIVATSAFGMGIDKPDIRAVVHFEIPATLEAYYQESGRAGRDGARAFGILLFDLNDARKLEHRIRANFPTEPELRAVYGALHDIVSNAVGSIYERLVVVNSVDILRSIPKPSASIERILDILEELGYVKNMRPGSLNLKPRVQFIASKRRLEEIAFTSKSPALKTTLSGLMRTLGAEAFEREMFLDEIQFQRAQHLESTEFVQAIRSLESLGVIRYLVQPKPKQGSSVFTIQLIGERYATARLPIPFGHLEDRMNRALAKLYGMIEYAREWKCRRNTILSYFGERPSSANCGRCDVCVKQLEGMELTL
jgi:ATP-dependent DNA helicase RecQ